MLPYFKRIINQNIREIAVFIVIIFLATFTNIRSGGNFFTSQNINDVLVESAVMVIMSMGMMMVIITTGIDLSVGSIMALSAMVATTIMKNNLTISPVVVILIAMGVGLLCGLINGVFISYVNIPPIIVTLGMMNVFRGLAYVVSKGSWVLQQDMSKSFMSIATTKVLGINMMVIFAIVVVIVNNYFMNYSRRGREIYAVGNSEESAKISGINTKKVKLFVYSIMGVLAGLGGILYVCKYAASQGETAKGYELNIIAACVLGGVSVSGGTGKVYGAVLGALLLGVLTNALPLLNVSPFWQEFVKGAIILISILANVLISRRVQKKAIERRATDVK